MTHEISRMACKIWAGDRSTQQMKEFADATWMLERSIVSLIHGMPSMAIIPAPTSDIRIDLQTALREWRSMKVFVIGMTKNDVPDVAKRMIYERLNEQHDRLNQIVQLYTDYSKHLY